MFLIYLWQNNLSEMLPSSYLSATELFHKDPIANVQLFQVSNTIHIVQAWTHLYF